MSVESILLLFSIIILLGVFAEWVFKKTGISDTLILIIIGFLIGKFGFSIVSIESLHFVAPVFTTFTLYFIMFDGSLYIKLKSLKEGLEGGTKLATVNFLISSLVIMLFFYIVGIDIVLSSVIGFALGGVSSSFVIPFLKQINPSEKIFSIMTFESAITDVFSIVFAFTAMEVKIAHKLKVGDVFSQITSLFSVAILIGILAGILWMKIEGKIVDYDKNYFMMIAYITLVYIITQSLNGNGAIAVLFLGIVLANSKSIIKAKEELFNDTKEKVRDYISKRERYFYAEISFFLKTFFFVYIGIAMNFGNAEALLIGVTISISIMLIRNISDFFIRKIDDPKRGIINAVFARGIAPAAIITMFQEKGQITTPLVVDIVYVVIVSTIVLTSLRIFFFNLKIKKKLQ